MEIRVRLFGDLVKCFEGEKRLEVEARTTPTDLLGLLRLDEREVGVIALNGELSTGSRELQDGDRVELFPLMGGG